MRKFELNNLMQSYFKWLGEETSVQVLDEYIEITTPYLDRHNDYLQIYVKEENGKITLTDGGYIIDDLALSGCDFTGNKRKALLNTVVEGLGVSIENGALTVSSDRGGFPLKKQSLIQAMLAVNDLYYISQPVTANRFFEDVESWFNSQNVRYTPNVSFNGQSGLSNKFDFSIPKSKKKPERIIELVNNLNKEAIINITFKWLDAKNTRPTGAMLLTLVNDIQYRASPQYESALRNYGITSVEWSKRDEKRELFCA